MPTPSRRERVRCHGRGPYGRASERAGHVQRRREPNVHDPPAPVAKLDGSSSARGPQPQGPSHSKGVAGERCASLCEECMGGGGIPLPRTERLEDSGSTTAICAGCLERLELDEEGFVPPHEQPDPS